MIPPTLTVTADDFGISPELNEAVEIAHRDGILNAASLMVAESWVANALERARRMPNLAIGLHLTLVERKPVLPASDIPDLIGPDGKLRNDVARYGAAIFLRPKVQREVAAEIEAQFEAYRATGLPLHHVDAHRHFHLHPTVARLLLAIGPRFGMRRLRVPVEPMAVLRRVEAGMPRRLEGLLAAPYARFLRTRARHAGLEVADQVFGLAWSGGMTTERLAGLLREMPAERTEIFTHPATRGGYDGSAPGYRYADELAALCAPAVRAAFEQRGSAAIPRTQR